MMYWRFSYLLTCVVATLRFVSSVVASSDENFPIGISLGIDDITSAYIIENEDFVATAIVKTTQAWKDFSSSLLGTERDAKESRKYTESEVNELLNTELSSIRKATKAKLNREIEILGITCPDFISEHGYTRNLMDVASQNQPGVKNGVRAWPYLHSIRIAYRLNNAKTLGYPLGTDIDLEDSHLLHFDYQNSLLKVSITTIGTDTINMKSHFRIPDFGGARQIASQPKKLEYLGTRTKALINGELSGPPTPYDPPRNSRILDASSLVAMHRPPSSKEYANRS